jgi:hypothetical protein
MSLINCRSRIQPSTSARRPDRLLPEHWAELTRKDSLGSVTARCRSGGRRGSAGSLCPVRHACSWWCAQMRTPTRRARQPAGRCVTRGLRSRPGAGDEPDAGLSRDAACTRRSRWTGTAQVRREQSAPGGRLRLAAPLIPCPRAIRRQGRRLIASLTDRSGNAEQLVSRLVDRAGEPDVVALVEDL